MRNRVLGMILVIIAFIGCERNASNSPGGRFLLFERPVGSDAPEAIDFCNGGRCIIEGEEHASGVGSFSTGAGGLISIKVDAVGEPEIHLTGQIHKRTFVLQRESEAPLYYVRVSDGRYPSFYEILGRFYVHTDLGYSVGEITADRQFHSRLRNLNLEDHTYYDVHIDGRCSYSNGVVTYLPEVSDAPQQDKYLRDFIVRRDESGLWVIDPFHDSIVCERLVTNFDMPSAPAGFRKSNAQ